MLKLLPVFLLIIFFNNDPTSDYRIEACHFTSIKYRNETWCCPDPTGDNGTNTTKKTTRRPTTSGCRCGIEFGTSNRIVGGAEINPINKYPWLVRIDTSGFCAGTLVASKYVISCAHCFFMNGTTLNTPMENISLRLGVHSLRGSGETFLEEKKIGVVNVHRHPKYIKNLDPWDITVVELAESIDLNVYTPACLAKTTDTNIFLGKKVTVAGWGGLLSTSDKIVNPDVPHEVQVPVRKCKNYPSTIICAQEKGKGGCYGDSGGPLTYKQDNGQHTLIGVVHSGPATCGPGQNQYVRISEVRKWIESKMSNPKFCAGGANAA